MWELKTSVSVSRVEKKYIKCYIEWKSMSIFNTCLNTMMSEQDAVCVYTLGHFATVRIKKLTCTRVYCDLSSSFMSLLEIRC